MKNSREEIITPSHTSPRGGRRGCLCRHKDTYSIECCKGDIMNQGVGSIYLDPND
jgi:hypothetical protein